MLFLGFFIFCNVVLQDSLGSCLYASVGRMDTQKGMETSMAFPKFAQPSGHIGWSIPRLQWILCELPPFCVLPSLQLGHTFGFSLSIGILLLVIILLLRATIRKIPSQSSVYIFVPYCCL